jgi:glyoxylase-like metal-dependent hydrolase (beta-lactamase superfamily II)
MVHRLVALVCALAACGPEPGVFRLAHDQTNAYLVVGTDGVALVDTLAEGREHWLLDELAAFGVAPGELDVIVLTHGHGDHAGSAAALRALTGAPIAIGAGDLEVVRRGEIDEIRPTGAFGRRRLERGRVHRRFPGFEPDIVVEDALDLHAFGVPARMEVVGDGHTPGSAVIRLDSGDVLVGDLVRGRVVIPGAPAEHLFHDDVARVHDQLAGLIEDGAGWFWPGHGGPVSARRVKRWLQRQ